MLIDEVNCTVARTHYLDPHAQRSGNDNGGGKVWHRFEVLNDPAVFLKTEDYLATIREQAEFNQLRNRASLEAALRTS